MDLSALFTESEPPSDLGPAAGEIWRELAKDVRCTIEEGSFLAQKLTEEPEKYRGALLHGFGKVCTIIAAVRECRKAGLPLPSLHPLDVELLVRYGIRPRWLIN